jgi:hypothetical protein
MISRNTQVVIAFFVSILLVATPVVIYLFVNDVTPCTDVVSGLDMGFLVFTNLFSCDKWAVPHLLAPFLVTIMTRDVYFGFTIAGVSEVVEYLTYAIFGDFVIFISNTDVAEAERVENVAGILLEDWLIQAGIGAVLLGWTFITLYPGKAFVEWRQWRTGRFWFYLIVGILMMASGFLYPLIFGSFYFGVLMYPVLHTVFVVVIWVYEEGCIKKGRFYAGFWLDFLLFSFAISVSNLFDYAYSGPIQSWFISAWFLVYMFLRILFRSSAKPLNRA